MTPTILTRDTARKHRMVWLNALASHLDPRAVQLRKGARITFFKGSMSRVQVFHMDDA